MKGTYQKEISHSSQSKVDLILMWRFTRVCRIPMAIFYEVMRRDKLLVASSRQDFEAKLLQEEYYVLTVGIDLYRVTSKIHSLQDPYFLQKQNLIKLAICVNSFSLIYCYHVLEHVTDYLSALKELYRVLKTGGVLFIGFPNKNRLFAYIGTSQHTTLKEKILWNITDYKYKVEGKFENRYGAHAGFTEKTFTKIAQNIFDYVIPVRNRYILLKYKH